MPTISLKRQPCKKDCPDRRPGCHATCPKYQEFAAERRALYRHREQAAIADSYIQDMHNGWFKRYTNKKGR